MITFSKLGQYGRFGNQLWQIASTIGIATKNQENFCFPEWGYQEYFPNKIPTGYVNNAEIYHEPYYGFTDVKLRNTDWDLQGYFQSWIYFFHCDSMIRHYFDFNKIPHDGVAVHVRRGDYLGKQNVHPILSLEYYLEGMSYFNGENFVVFSDDMEWCKENLKGKNISYYNTGNDIRDFKAMCGFSKFIIANSSYSWWAAYLSKDSMVIAPELWVHGEEENHRVPPEWTRI